MRSDQKNRTFLPDHLFWAILEQKYTMGEKDNPVMVPSTRLKRQIGVKGKKESFTKQETVVPVFLLPEWRVLQENKDNMLTARHKDTPELFNFKSF